MSDGDDDLPASLMAGCGCASAISLFVLAPAGVFLGGLFGGFRWAYRLGAAAVVAGPIALTAAFWGMLALVRWRRRDEDDTQ